MFSAFSTVIKPRRRDLLGGFMVGRALPSIERRSVGPFIFFDHMGPAAFAPGKGLDVRPHPHIGLATVTYLFEGEIMHRDNLGSVQAIRPGDVNWMVAGEGIVHSERTKLEVRRVGHKLHGIQCWLGLPKEHEKIKASFTHHPANKLPTRDKADSSIRVMLGSGFGMKSPVKVFSPTLYADAILIDGASIDVPADHPERAIYVVEGALDNGGKVVEAGEMVILLPDAEAAVKAKGKTRFVVVGGAPLDGPRHLWWNFVASEQALIDKAKVDWDAAVKGKISDRFGPPPDEKDLIPLPNM
jgi:hypothetical protein